MISLVAEGDKRADQDRPSLSCGIRDHRRFAIGEPRQHGCARQRIKRFFETLGSDVLARSEASWAGEASRRIDHQLRLLHRRNLLFASTEYIRQTVTGNYGACVASLIVPSEASLGHRRAAALYESLHAAGNISAQHDGKGQKENFVLGEAAVGDVLGADEVNGYVLLEEGAMKTHQRVTLGVAEFRKRRFGAADHVGKPIVEDRHLGGRGLGGENLRCILLDDFGGFTGGAGAVRERAVEVNQAITV